MARGLNAERQKTPRDFFVTATNQLENAKTNMFKLTYYNKRKLSTPTLNAFNDAYTAMVESQCKLRDAIRLYNIDERAVENAL